MKKFVIVKDKAINLAHVSEFQEITEKGKIKIVLHMVDGKSRTASGDPLLDEIRNYITDNLYTSEGN